MGVGWGGVLLHQGLKNSMLEERWKSINHGEDAWTTMSNIYFRGVKDIVSRLWISLFKLSSFLLILLHIYFVLSFFPSLVFVDIICILVS